MTETLRKNVNLKQKILNHHIKKIIFKILSEIKICIHFIFTFEAKIICLANEVKNFYC